MVEDGSRRSGQDDVAHYVVTRINTYHRDGVNQDPIWARERTRLFREHTLSCMKRQTERRLHWILFFDVDTPEELFKDVVSETYDIGASVVYHKGRFTPSAVSQTIKNLHWGLEDQPEWILTSRLDSDDLICDEFLKLVRSEFERGRKAGNDFSIELTNGVVYWEDMRHACASEKLSKNFITYAEKVDEDKALRTCYENTERPTIQSKQLRTRAAWCKMVHNANGLYDAKPHRRWPKVCSDVMSDRFHLEVEV